MQKALHSLLFASFFVLKWNLMMESCSTFFVASISYRGFSHCWEARRTLSSKCLFLWPLEFIHQGFYIVSFAFCAKLIWTAACRYGSSSEKVFRLISWFRSRPIHHFPTRAISLSRLQFSAEEKRWNFCHNNNSSALESARDSLSSPYNYSITIHALSLKTYCLMGKIYLQVKHQQTLIMEKIK